MDPTLERLDPRWVSASRMASLGSSAFVALVLAAGVAFATLVAEAPFLPTLLIALIVLAAIMARGLAWPAIAYRHSAYRLGSRSLEIRRGVLWRSVIDVPRSRIQHSDVSQGPFERMYGLGTLSVFTAGNMHSQVQLPGLDHTRAMEIREHLMQSDDDDVV